ncbi:hypothetical protein ATANTOWER_023596, partial [Ataeniobius toweri]|nr:hypothetical protein [Ataeniobius toweri]
KPVRCGLLPTELDSDILHLLLLFVNLDYSSLTVARFLTFLTPASVRTLDRTLDKLFGLPDSQAQWYDPPEFLCSSDQVSKTSGAIWMYFHPRSELTLASFFSGPEEPSNPRSSRTLLVCLNKPLKLVWSPE